VARKLLRSIFCGLPVEPGDLESFVYRNYCIGRWYYERAPAELRRPPSRGEHERLHLIAARMLSAHHRRARGTRRLRGPVATARFRIEVDSLRLTLEAAMVNRDPLTGRIWTRRNGAGTAGSCWRP
jgi:hypothetical protein